jgi:hypothetical protein
MSWSGKSDFRAIHWESSNTGSVRYFPPIANVGLLRSIENALRKKAAETDVKELMGSNPQNGISINPASISAFLQFGYQSALSRRIIPPSDNTDMADTVDRNRSAPSIRTTSNYLSRRTGTPAYA